MLGATRARRATGVCLAHLLQRILDLLLLHRVVILAITLVIVLQASKHALLGLDHWRDQRRPSLRWFVVVSKAPHCAPGGAHH